MTQDMRNRIAAALAVILVPVMVYLLAVNIREVRRRAHPSRESAPAVVFPAAAPPEIPMPAPAEIDPAVLKEQQNVAARRPARNPFYPLPAPSEPGLPAISVPEDAAAAPPLELSGIIFGKTADRRSAIINGKMLGEGKTIAGYRIVAIGPGEVVLSSGTNRVTLRLEP